MYTALLQGSLRLSRFGEWWHEGTPFANPRVADLFHRSIAWDTDRGAFVIRIGAQQALFEVEDTAFFVTRIDTSTTPWEITLNDGRALALDPQSLAIGAEGQFYCLVPKERVHATTSTDLERTYARFERGPHQVLVQHAAGENSINICGSLITPRRRDEH